MEKAITIIETRIEELKKELTKLEDHSAILNNMFVQLELQIILTKLYQL